MTNKRDVLHSGAIGQAHGPGPGHEADQGHGHASGRGRGRSPGRGKASARKGKGRGRVTDTISRFENSSGSSGSSASSRLVGDFTPGRGHSIGFQSNKPGKQPSLSGLHNLLVGSHSFARGYTPPNRGTDLTPLAFGNATRRGRLSWADMRRQSQHSSSTADDSSEPDRSYRGFLNVGGSDGGWGGRGRGRLLDTSSVKKSCLREINFDTSSFGGRGRGGILYVPGVNFHSGLGSTGWKGSSSNRGTQSLRHSVGGYVTNSTVPFCQSFQGKESAPGLSTNWQQNKKFQIRQKKAECKKNNKDVKTDNLRRIDSSGKGDSHTQGSFVPSIQPKDESIRKVENTEAYSSNGSKTVTGANKQVIDTISLAGGGDEKLLHQSENSDVNNIEESMQKLLNIESDAVTAKMQKSVMPVIYSTEQKGDREDTWKPVHCSPRGGCTRGVVLLGASIITDGDSVDMRSAVKCERGIEENPSDLQVTLKPENNCSDKVCGAVV